MYFGEVLMLIDSYSQTSHGQHLIMKNIQVVTEYKGNLGTCFTATIVNIEIIGVLSFFKNVLVAP